MKDFAPRLLAWYRQHGRHDLPWQNTRDPYAIWVSEIMLQQTQVATVIPYYQRFMGSFPDIVSLAAADEDEVLALWAGLGYYSRARNLHKAAQILLDKFGGRFPESWEQIVDLPGIGPSTAAAISAFAWNKRRPILDGNVKRVLARCFAVDGWPGTAAVQKQLWELADALTPATETSAYTQAIMDLGATLCRRNQPRCGECPFSNDCLAHQQDCVSRYPGKKPKKSIPLRHAVFLIIRDRNDATLLIKRPPSGIWGGLWSLPEHRVSDESARWAENQLGLFIRPESPLSSFRHTFSHYHLDICPVPARLVDIKNGIRDAPGMIWLKPGETPPGIPAPVKKILEKLP
ncbi:MAG: A/G-specific adenine glycosylase [Gammaproteobacteria bacterium]|nr:MAG: A/G-specific adenine glycosylase [Gammaproteobacteria bacterium]